VTEKQAVAAIKKTADCSDSRTTPHDGDTTMRLNEQRDTLVEAIEDAGCDLIGLRASILRKMAAPYGDGSRSNMVNAETDVLPRLVTILDRLQAAMDAISGTRVHVFGTDDADRIKSKAVRIW
jgi:hypothetical protein